MSRPPPSRVHPKNSTPRRCRSAKADSSGTILAANAPLRWWRVGLRTSVLVVVVEFSISGFGKATEEEGSQQSPSLAARVAHAPPLRYGSNGRDFVAYFGFVNGGVAFSNVGWADRGFGKAKWEEGSQCTPSSVSCMAHASPLLPISDGRDRGLERQRRKSYLNVMGNEAVKDAFEDT
ncbi:hypothetical protein Cgig2_019263 [Carnegiea gigantea]|uniref:Uncharacterized protein n=1 Tax=Carnegiea gigantea TaxID=171969 RepID=A0A9Q1QNB1_9CARY|nr:hypothetical protein Cgig2_019263 [Carnegiea gigantea]